MLESEIARSTGFTIGGLAGIAIVALGFQGRSALSRKKKLSQYKPAKASFVKTYGPGAWVLIKKLLTSFGCEVEPRGITGIQFRISAKADDLLRVEIKIEKFVSESEVEEITQTMSRYKAIQTESYIYKEKMQ